MTLELQKIIILIMRKVIKLKIQFKKLKMMIIPLIFKQAI
jgi:hypothetical protein